jgi:HPr kinase/phosphorylase
MKGALSKHFHATAAAVAVDADGPLAGALIIGPSGSGKSSLALMVIEACPFQRSALVADDAVIIEQAVGGLIARAPDRIRGLIEIRGFGPSAVRAISACPLVLAVDLGAATERMPAPLRLGECADAAAIPLYPFLWKDAEATAPYRLRRMIAAILGGQSPRRAQDRDPVWSVERG